MTGVESCFLQAKNRNSHACAVVKNTDEMMREPEDEESVLQLCSLREPEDFRMNDPAPAESAGGLRLTLASLTDSDSHLHTRSFSSLCLVWSEDRSHARPLDGGSQPSWCVLFLEQI